MTSFFFLLLSYQLIAQPIEIKDNILFGFERCKTLSVDLQKGQLKESIATTFDVVCRKKAEIEFDCEFYETGSSKKIGQEVFTGGSELGIGELKSANGQKITFLIGKPFASFYSGGEQKACVGLFFLEKEALKKAKKRIN
jgi:hypothetical protein